MCLFPQAAKLKQGEEAERRAQGLSATSCNHLFYLSEKDSKSELIISIVRSVVE